MYHQLKHDLGNLHTPCYYYDMQLLRNTLEAIAKETQNYPFVVHYAVKANGNPVIMKEIKDAGLGVDLVSGGELKAVLEAGFEASKVTFSGVGKTDWEIRLGLENNIYCFNVESIPELEVINEIALQMGTEAGIAIRVNPNIDAHTHRYITTGTAGDKFGISLEQLPQVVALAQSLPAVKLRGLHFHIGSQITSMRPYEMLCEKVNEIQDQFEQQGITFDIINLGGGLGIDYDDPDQNPIPRFADLFGVVKRNLRARPGQSIHFELGRSIVAQCGSLISRVVYVKENCNKKFVILDAGMTDLLRPALYQAHHKIENLTASCDDGVDTYDVVGPVCESSDVFARNEQLPVSHRGDIIAIRSAGAYGESMANRYNMRSLPHSHFSL